MQAALDVTERQRHALGQMQAQLMDTVWSLQQQAIRDTPKVRLLPLAALLPANTCSIMAMRALEMPWLADLLAGWPASAAAKVPD